MKNNNNNNNNNKFGEKNNRLTWKDATSLTVVVEDTDQTKVFFVDC